MEFSLLEFSTANFVVRCTSVLLVVVVVAVAAVAVAVVVQNWQTCTPWSGSNPHQCFLYLTEEWGWGTV